MNPDWMEKWFHSRFLFPLLYSTTSSGEWGLKPKVVSWIQIEWKSGFILVSFSHFYIVLVWGMGIETKSRVMNPDWMEKWFHSRFLFPLLYSTTIAVGNGDWNQKSCHESRLNGKVVSFSFPFPLLYSTTIAVGNGDWNQKSCHESRLNGKVVSFSFPYPTSI